MKPVGLMNESGGRFCTFSFLCNARVDSFAVFQKTHVVPTHVFATSISSSVLECSLQRCKSAAAIAFACLTERTQLQRNEKLKN